LLLVGLAAFSFRHRQTPGTFPFSIACIFGLFWTLGAVFEFSAIDIGLKIIWRKFQVVFQLPAATAITCFLLEYTWPKRWLTRRNLFILSIPPTLVFLLIITNNFHYLFWEGFNFDGGLAAIPGPVMKYFLAYVFLNFLINLIILVWLFIHSPHNRWPMAIIMVGQIMMRLFYFIDFADRAPTNIQYSAVGIAFTSFMYAIVFFRFNIFGPITLARRRMIEQLPIGMIVLDDHEKIRNLNPAAEKMLKLSNNSSRGMDIWKVLPSYAQHLADADEDTGKVSGDFVDGEHNYQLSISILRDWRDLQVGQLLLVEDVTNQRLAQKKILEQQRVVSTLQEREMIARELHDDLAQVFAFIDTQGQTIQRLLDRGDLISAQKLLMCLIEAARNGEVDVREAIRGMRSTLSKNGLLGSLNDYLVEFEKNTAIQTEIIKSEILELSQVPAMVEVQLFRILQEALTNIRKHANATKVQIKFEKIDKTICVTVQDNGKGFEISEDVNASNNHYGLLMMQERADAMGGTIKLTSQTGYGTEIKVCVPIMKDGL
jgi:PAS domain S-box-containing protein